MTSYYNCDTNQDIQTLSTTKHKPTPKMIDLSCLKCY